MLCGKSIFITVGKSTFSICHYQTLRSTDAQSNLTIHTVVSKHILDKMLSLFQFTEILIIPCRIIYKSSCNVQYFLHNISINSERALLNGFYPAGTGSQ